MVKRLIELAIIYKHEPVLKQVLKHFDVKVNGWHMGLAVMANSPEILQILQGHGGDVNQLGRMVELCYLLSRAEILSSILRKNASGLGSMPRSNAYCNVAFRQSIIW